MKEFKSLKVMSYVVLFILFISCSSMFSNALEFDFYNYTTTAIGDYAVVSYPGSDLDFPGAEPYVEVLYSREFIEGNDEITGLKFELFDPIKLDLNLPIVSGVSKDEFDIIRDFDCNSDEVTAGAKLFSTSYDGEYTSVSIVLNPLESNGCEGFTFYRRIMVDFEYGEPLPTIDFIDFNYPLKKGDNTLTVHFSNTPHGMITIEGNELDDITNEYDILLNESADSLVEQYNLSLDSKPEPFTVEYSENSRIISRYVLSNIVQWGDFDFIIADTSDDNIKTLIIEVNNTLKKDFNINFEVSKILDWDDYSVGNMSHADSFTEFVSGKNNFSKFKKNISFTQDILGISIEGSALDYSHTAAHNAYVTFDADVDTSAELPKSPLQEAIKELKKDNNSKNQNVKTAEVLPKSKIDLHGFVLDANIIAVVIAVFLTILLGVGYYYFIIK